VPKQSPVVPKQFPVLLEFLVKRGLPRRLRARAAARNDINLSERPRLTLPARRFSLFRDQVGVHAGEFFEDVERDVEVAGGDEGRGFGPVGGG